MDENRDNPPAAPDAELQREILTGRKFTLGEAVGRMAGGGLMKGVSPIAGKQQAEAVLEEYLLHNLSDAPGALRAVLFRRVREGELLLKGFEHPFEVLADNLRLVLESEYLLRELVRDADVEWGREFGEKPHFEREGCPPDPDDPYTVESVRGKLTRLRETLGPGADARPPRATDNRLPRRPGK